MAARLEPRPKSQDCIAGSFQTLHDLNHSLRKYVMGLRCDKGSISPTLGGGGLAAAMSVTWVRMIDRIRIAAPTQQHEANRRCTKLGGVRLGSISISVVGHSRFNRTASSCTSFAPSGSFASPGNVAMPMQSSSSATIANCACYAAGSVGSSATSAARSPDGPSSRRSSKRRWRALRRSDRNSSASVDRSSISSTPPRSNASFMKGCGSPGCRRAEVRSGRRRTRGSGKLPERRDSDEGFLPRHNRLVKAAKLNKGRPNATKHLSVSRVSGYLR
jgi:hypothetical protein